MITKLRSSLLLTALLLVSTTGCLSLDLLLKVACTEDALLNAGGETKISACNTSSSHSSTVVRKLPIMTPTPIITLTATISAATATPPESASCCTTATNEVAEHMRSRSMSAYDSALMLVN